MLNEQPKPDVPIWIESVNSAERVSVPFENNLSSRELFRIAVKKDKGIKIVGRNNIEKQSSFIAIPFRDGKPANKTSYYNSIHFNSKEQVDTIFFEESPLEASEIIVRVNKGNVRIKVDQFKMPKGRIITWGNRGKFKLRPNKQYNIRLVNLITGKSSCKISFYKNRKRLSDDKLDSLNIYSYDFKYVYELQQNLYEQDANELVINVKEGEILARVYREK